LSSLSNIKIANFDFFYTLSNEAKVRRGVAGGQPQSGKAILGHKDWQCGVSEANTTLPI